MSDLTPEQLIALLIQELSASGAAPLLDNDDQAKPFTLRTAIGRILWKVNQSLPLENRPLDPLQKDDLFGQVLSLRAELIQTKAMVAAMAVTMNIDVNRIMHDVRDELNKNV